MSLSDQGNAAASTPGQQAPSPSVRQRAPMRLEFLDGIRGLAALYVVLFHLYGNTPDLPTETWRRLATGWTRLGWYSVAVFIVLSGYCLMLPLVAAGTGRLRDGFGPYLKRRARRILPPYYAALVIGIFLLLATTWWSALPPGDIHTGGYTYRGIYIPGDIHTGGYIGR